MLQRCLPGALVLILVGATPSAARQAPAAPPPAQQPEQKPEQVPVPEESPVYKEQVVVTASKTEQALVNAPATVSLIAGETLQNNASTSYADLFRAVPGLNVTQTSARDINITSRGATSTLSTGAAGAGRRPQHLPGLLRLRRLGLSAGEPRRDQADRSHPRSGVRDLGRQRDERASSTSSPSRRASCQGTSVTLGVGTFGREVAGSAAEDNGIALLRQRVALAGRQRPLGVQGLGGRATRRTRWRGRPAICQAARAAIRRSPTTGTTQPKLERARRLRLRGRPAQAGVPGRRGGHRRHPAQRHRAVRHQLAAPSLATAR